MEINRVNHTHFEGTKKVSKDKKTFDKSVGDMISTLYNRAEREVQEYGDFAQVFERIKNSSKVGNATDFVLNIKRPEDSEPTDRVVEAIAYKLPNPYKYTHTVAYGTKAEILKAMQDEDFAQKVQETFERLSTHFE